MPYTRRPAPRRRFNRRRNGFVARRQRRYQTIASNTGRVPYVSAHPKSMVVKMRFALNQGAGHALASTSGALIDWTYRSADCYDPYFLSGGAQPRGFDQYMTMFRHGIVLKSKIDVKFMYADDDGIKYPMKVGVLLSDSGTAITSINTVSEHARCASAILAPQSGTVKRIRFNYTPRSFFSIKNVQDADELHFSSGSSPTENAIFHVWGYGLDAATEEAFVDGHIDYTVLLLHPIIPTAS